MDWFGEGYGNNDWVFRGEPEPYPAVLPLLDRLLPRDGNHGSINDRLEAEVQAMLRFRQHAPMHLRPIEADILEEGMQAQTIMRHYGVPTRLLDWTESPWVALFFACEDAAGPPPRRGPGRILAFKRNVLEDHVKRNYGGESQAHARMVPGSAGWTIPEALTVRFAEHANDWVVCYHRHAVKFPRLVVQQGLFTMASKPWLDHWELIRHGCGPEHRELRIAPELKMVALRRLAKMGVTAASLFPDIEGVAREVAASIVLLRRL